MNYYERHLGDYARDTAHLSMLEHGAYSLLLDRYYATEAGIQADQAHRLARARTKEEKQAVDAVLHEFFIIVDGVWINQRAEEEIAKAQTRIKAAKENGKRGGRPRTNQTETQEKPGGLFVGSENETQSKAHQAPYTIHQTKTQEAQAATTDLDPAAASPPPSADPVQARALELVMLLRQRGAAIAAGNQHARHWAEAGITDAQALAALEIAEQRRADARSVQPVNSGFLNAIIDDQQRATPQRKTIHDERAETIAALTGRSRNHEQHESGNVIDITPTAVAGNVD